VALRREARGICAGSVLDRFRMNGTDGGLCFSRRTGCPLRVLPDTPRLSCSDWCAFLRAGCSLRAPLFALREGSRTGWANQRALRDHPGQRSVVGLRSVSLVRPGVPHSWPALLFAGRVLPPRVLIRSQGGATDGMGEPTRAAGPPRPALCSRSAQGFAGASRSPSIGACSACSRAGCSLRAPLFRSQGGITDGMGEPTRAPGPPRPTESGWFCTVFRSRGPGGPSARPYSHSGKDHGWDGRTNARCGTTPAHALFPLTADD
jgi:hypothetical protein